MPQVSRWLKTAIAAALAGAVLYLFWVFPKGKPSSLADNPECPHNWEEMISYTLKNGSKMSASDSSMVHQGGELADGLEITASVIPNPDVPPGGFGVPGATTNVPEFHDCQKLRE